MTIENIVKGCMLPVTWYATNLYDWEKHNLDEKQENKDINKPGGFIKVFKDSKGNTIYILKSKSIETLPEMFEYEFTDKSVEQMKEILTKEFYFCMVQKNGDGEVTFPNEIWLNLEDAKKGCAKYLL